jgi:hypothetical protein
MTAETAPQFPQPLFEEDHRSWESESLRTQKLQQRHETINTLGDMVLGIVVGGALGSGNVMPRTEAITLELIAGTTELADGAEEQVACAA